MIRFVVNVYQINKLIKCIYRIFSGTSRLKNFNFLQYVNYFFLMKYEINAFVTFMCKYDSPNVL